MSKKKAVKATKAKVTVVKAAEVVKTPRLTFSDWTTYDVARATYRIGHNPDAHYGVFLFQIKKADDETWLVRVVEKNEQEEPGRVTIVREGQASLYCTKAAALARSLKAKINSLMPKKP